MVYAAATPPMTHAGQKLTVHLLANARSGKGQGDSIGDKVKAVCEELGHTFVSHEVKEPSELEGAAEKAVKLAINDNGVVMAAGGDGTIRTVAEKVQGTEARMAVIPCGTFNYFARTHKIPEDHDAAIRLGLTGDCRPVRLGEVNGRVFLINASLGMYVDSIHEREKNTEKWGRSRFVAVLSTLRTFISDHRLLHVDMLTGNEHARMRTPMIFIGNNALQLRNLKLEVAGCMKDDALAVVAMKPLTKWEKVRVITRGALRTIDNEERLQSFCINSLSIYSHPLSQEVALDGEIFRMVSPFQVKALPAVLNMMLPPREAIQ